MYIAEMAFRKREFLAPVSTGTTSYIFAEVENSENGEYKIGHNMLTIADCHHKINLEFFLGRPKARKESLAKLKLLQTILVEFGEALTKEANLIEAASKKKAKK